MRLLLDTLIFVLWVATYLGAVHAIASYRRAHAHAEEGIERQAYRAEKDVGLRVIVFLVGILLGVGAFFARRVLG